MTQATALGFPEQDRVGWERAAPPPRGVRL
jgi:hypothetical protein